MDLCGFCGFPNSWILRLVIKTNPLRCGVHPDPISNLPHRSPCAQVSNPFSRRLLTQCPTLSLRIWALNWGRSRILFSCHSNKSTNIYQKRYTHTRLLMVGGFTFSFFVPKMRSWTKHWNIFFGLEKSIDLRVWCSTYPILLSMSCPDNFRWLQARRVPALQMIRSPRQPHLNCGGSMSQILESVWILYTRYVSSASCWQESDRFSFAAVWAKIGNVCVDGWNTILSRIRFRDPDIGSVQDQSIIRIWPLCIT